MGVGRTKTLCYSIPSYVIARSRERDSFSRFQEERVRLYDQVERGKRVCPPLLHCPGLGDHFARKSPSLPTLLLFSIVAVTVSFLIAASGKLSSVQHMISAFCASI